MNLTADEPEMTIYPQNLGMIIHLCHSFNDQVLIKK
ncbi:MAG: hypothetical protein BMS9Abin33_0048 [Gammaproteobacteria bacterium]|nr:MAG: hypothetical protein BMS9Abin33_0048 [Gammaproteobacteria bacterium]